MIGYGLALGQERLSEKDRLRTELELADQILNQKYQRIMAGLKEWANSSELPEGTGLGTKRACQDLISDLKKAQRAWIVFRDADADLMHAQTAAYGGRGGPGDALVRKIDMTNERIQFLTKHFEN